MEKKLLFQKESIQLKNKMLFKIIKHMNNKILSLFFNQWDKRIIHIKNYHKRLKFIVNRIKNRVINKYFSSYKNNIRKIKNQRRLIHRFHSRINNKVLVQAYQCWFNNVNDQIYYQNLIYKMINKFNFEHLRCLLRSSFSKWKIVNQILIKNDYIREMKHIQEDRKRKTLQHIINHVLYRALSTGWKSWILCIKGKHKKYSILLSLFQKTNILISFLTLIEHKRLEYLQTRVTLKWKNKLLYHALYAWRNTIGNIIRQRKKLALAIKRMSKLLLLKTLKYWGNKITKRMLFQKTLTFTLTKKKI